MASNPVEELLKDKGIYFTFSGKDFVTKCFNPDHSDNNPSFRIDRVSGVGHCFSCHFKFNIFKYYGLLTNNVSIRIVKLKEKLKALNESTNGLAPLDGAVPVNSAFRGISAKTLKLFGAFYTDLIPKMEDRVIFPIKDVRGKTVAYIGRHSMSDGNPRYQNYPTGATIPLFPTKFTEPFRSIVLVEGLFDLLNLYDNGLHNVVCTFGTSKLLNDVDTKLLSYKVMGIEKIYVLYDGDTPGREAAAKIKPLIEAAGFMCEIINLPDDLDPGELPEQDISNIIEYVR